MKGDIIGILVVCCILIAMIVIADQLVSWYFMDPTTYSLKHQYGAGY